MKLPELHHPTASPSFTSITIGSLKIWFSYADVIAFQTDDQRLPYTMDPTDATQTTQRHTASLGESWELPPEQFNDALSHLLDRLVKAHV